MSEASSPNTSPMVPNPAASAPAKHGAGHRLVVLLVLAAAGASAYFLWHALQSTRQQVDADMASSRQQLEALARRTEQLEHQAGESLPGSIAALQTQQQSLEESIDKLRSETIGDASWVLEETAALLETANERLRLEGAVAPSLAALEAADRHLQKLRNPALFEVRRRLAEEINTLRSVANPDITGIALSLGTLIEGIDRLPLANGEITKDQAAAPGISENGWRGVLHSLWEKLKGLVVIKHRGAADRPLLAPDERYFLRQNLRLELESARIALLRRDSRTYQQTLRSSQDWIGRYFDNEAPGTANTLKELARLQQIDIAPILPDISGSSNALHTWLEQQRRQKSSATAQP